MSVAKCITWKIKNRTRLGYWNEKIFGIGNTSINIKIVTPFSKWWTQWRRLVPKVCGWFALWSNEKKDRNRLNLLFFAVGTRECQNLSGSVGVGPFSPLRRECSNWFCYVIYVSFTNGVDTFFSGALQICLLTNMW